MLTYREVLSLTQDQCRNMAYRYKQDAGELLSHCLPKLPGIYSRIDPELPIKAQKAFVRRSVRGYCLHWLRDCATLIKTPRGSTPYKVSEYQPSLSPPVSPFETPLPDWLEGLLDKTPTPPLVKRIVNAYLHLHYD